VTQFMSKHVACHVDHCIVESRKCFQTDVGFTYSCAGVDDVIYCLFNYAISRSHNIASDLLIGE